MRLGRHKLTSSKGLLDPPSLGVGITIGSEWIGFSEDDGKNGV